MIVVFGDRYRCDGSKNFLLIRSCLRRDVTQDRWFVEQSFVSTSGDQHGSGGHRVLDNAVYAIKLLLTDERADRNFLPEGVADRERGGAGGQFLCICVRDPSMHDVAAGGHADLSLVKQ